MPADSMPTEIHLPVLSDEAAVALHDFLIEFQLRVESHYFAQIHRYYADTFSNNLVQPSPFAHPPDDDPPF